MDLEPVFTGRRCSCFLFQYVEDRLGWFNTNRQKEDV